MSTKTQIKPPEILLIGAGGFGKAHLGVWKQLEQKGVAKLAGVVVNTEKSQLALQQVTSAPVYTELTTELLEQVDGVDIVTPAASHADLIKRCLPHAHVMVEKPVFQCVNDKESLKAFADQQSKHLMVGHIYRYHPVTQRLKELLANRRSKIVAIEGVFFNPECEWLDGTNINLEMLHWFDLIDYLLGLKFEKISSRNFKGYNSINLRSDCGVDVRFNLGWKGQERQRQFDVLLEDHKLSANFSDFKVVSRKRNKLEKFFLDPTQSPLLNELSSFLKVIQKETECYPSIEEGVRVAELALRAAPAKLPFVHSNPGVRPRVGIVGGGIFGATCALELSEFCDVTIIERHENLLQEASFLNQWRHHSGFHYPRSVGTIQEVVEAKKTFEDRYANVIDRSCPSYYCVSAYGHEISKEFYLATCETNGLSFSQSSPPPNVLNPETISLSLKTDEAVLNIDLFRETLAKQIRANKNITAHYGCEVTDGEISKDGGKRLTFNRNGVLESADFDYIVNTTYANSNLISGMLGFPVRSLRFDLLELLVIKLPIEKISITILDAPFTSLVNMAEENLFMLSHINESLIAAEVTKDGLPPRWGGTYEKPKNYPTNKDNLLKHGLRYLPILEHAEFVESRYGVRTVEAFSEDFDGRPTVVTPHGFGCWSVLGGKIITSVSNAEEISRAIKSELS